MNSIIVAILISLLVLPSLGMAQDKGESTNDWTNLKAVPVGQKLEVGLKNGERADGKLSRLSETILTLTKQNRLTDLNRDNVKNIYRVTGTSVGKTVVIATLTGAAAGSVLGIAGSCQAGQFCVITRGESTALGAALGAGIGAATGFIIGKVRHKKVLLYRQ